MVPFQDNSIVLKRLDGIVRDITEAKINELERERMINELLEKNTSLALFGYEVSHKVRAPVANVIALTALLKELPELSAAQIELMDHLEQSVDLLDNRIIDLNALLTTQKI
jgi:signal transduction histidine kinase